MRVSVFPNKGVAIYFDQGVEISLDCSICKRTHRTIIFEFPDQLGRCTPTGHVFEGQVGAMHVTTKEKGSQRVVECRFRLEYNYVSVEDQKYPHRASSRLPSWGRVHFRAKCPKCSADVNRLSIQTNIVRPWSCICKCGYELYTDRVVFPAFEDKTDNLISN
jgi:hypothetical protein